MSDKELRIAQKAQKIYDDIQGRLELIRTNLHKEWEISKAGDVEGREHAWNMLKALNELERSYLLDIETGKLAELEKEDG